MAQWEKKTTNCANLTTWVHSLDLTVGERGEPTPKLHIHAMVHLHTYLHT